MRDVMRMSWKLGRVAGINVYLHPTLLVVLLLPEVLRGGLGAVLVAASVFGCVLLHELGHALMARRFGIETEDITLYPIGGVARLRRMPRAPGAELLIALAGPAVNLLIVFGLVGLSALGLTAGLGEFVPLGGYFGVLIAVNLILALFNLIPAFPMDGGRVLRALLSGWLGRARATLFAARLGQLLALAFGAYCLLQGPAYWLQAVLAGFIYMAAGAELSRVLAEERHREFNTEGIWTAPPGFRWVNRGQGVWQLAPVVVVANDRDRPTWL
jgi:Zn-dependent protease